MKYVIICLDGMSDHPVSSLGGRTPLQAAKTPHLDRLARQGVVGAMQNTPPGFKAGSDVCNLSLLGYDCSGFYSGRAPYEAASMGIDLTDHHLVFRCNVVTVIDDVMVDFSAGHIDSASSKPLIEALQSHLGAEGLDFYPGIGYRHILRVDTRVHPYDFRKATCTPPHDIMGKNIKTYLPEGEGFAFIRDLMQRSVEVLAAHPVNRGRKMPANMIWLWGQGKRPAVASFASRFGLKGSVISAVDLVRGIGRLIDLDVIDVPGATGYYDTDYAAKGRYAMESLKKKDFIFVHIEATDEAGHNGDAVEKVRAIENADTHVLGPLMESLKGQPHRILVAPDHPTPVALRTHTEEYVPFVMCGEGLPRHETWGQKLYSEEVLSDPKALRFDRGHELIASFLSK